jgi:peptidoglycan biosynthesis protein MviN/MurJ (putative lipid II flippase)
MEMRASLIFAGVNLALSISLVRLIGPVGAPLGTACAGVLAAVLFLEAFRRQLAGRFDLDPVRPLVVPTVAAVFAGVTGYAALAATRFWALPAGRLGAVVELVATAVPFGMVYAAGVLRRSVLDDYDHRVARETWTIALSAIGRGANR